MHLPIRTVFFDVGETLLDETREFGAWADWLGVPRHTFSAVFGAVIAEGRDHRETFEYFRPGFDLDAERAEREADGDPETFSEADLYPDARPCLATIRNLGLRVGVAGNQTERSEMILRSLDLPVDVLRTSSRWGAPKPSPEFFQRIIDEAGCSAGEILYVGDRLDNDIVPALDLGLQCALIRRGPWAHIWSYRPEAGRCLFRLDGLTELPDLVRRHNAQLHA